MKEMNQFTPKISVIMPVYLRNEYLIPAMSSILEQTFRDFELLVVANNCSDELWEDLKTFQKTMNDERLKIFRTVIGQISFNLNFAVNESRAELIARMDADDIAYPNRLATQYEFMTKNSNVDVLGSSFDIINNKGIKTGSIKKPLTNSEIRRALPYKNPFCHPSVMFRKKTFIKNSGYLGGRYSEDYNFWLRLARNKDVVFHNIEEPLLQYRHSDFQTRGLRLAYAEVAGHLWAEFLLQFKFKYFLGSIISSLKIFLAKN
jgi:glycosyltransferase involved in cell wall biosynthesis